MYKNAVYSVTMKFSYLMNITGTSGACVTAVPIVDFF